VYDRPRVLWLVNGRFFSSLQVLNATFDPQIYAIALPQGSELRCQSTSPCSTRFGVIGGGRRCSHILVIAEVGIASPQAHSDALATPSTARAFAVSTTAAESP
jgi:hypothetical protein